MSVRIIARAGGALGRTFAWGDGTEVLTAGQLIDVEPGSALETAIGTGNLVSPTAAQLATAGGGGSGAVSNGT